MYAFDESCLCINVYVPCRKIGQGHRKVMIYIHIVVLESSMLHAKFG